MAASRNSYSHNLLFNLFLTFLTLQFQAVTGLCWQRSKPVVVNENSSSEVALLGGTSEESVLMPDPLPSATPTSLGSGVATTSLRSSLTANTSGYLSTSNSSTMEETPYRTRPLSGGPLSRLQAPRSNYNLKDDMDVFSPLVDVQPFTPSSGNWWDEHESDDTKKDDKPGEKKFSATRKYSYMEGNDEPHPIADWRSSANSRQVLHEKLICLCLRGHMSHCERITYIAFFFF